jgi:hypothetical protein
MQKVAITMKKQFSLDIKWHLANSSQLSTIYPDLFFSHNYVEWILFSFHENLSISWGTLNFDPIGAKQCHSKYQAPGHPEPWTAQKLAMSWTAEQAELYCSERWADSDFLLIFFKMNIKKTKIELRLGME